MASQRASDEGTPPIYSAANGSAEIRLNRPAHLNRLQAEDLGVLMEMLDRAKNDETVRVLVLTGTGRVFSSGYNLGDIAAGSSGRRDGDSSQDSPFEELTNTLEDLPLPTICKLNGPVYGGATDLALCCDFRIGTSDCEMFMPASRLGLHYYPSGIVRYVSRLGVNAAKKLFLTADKIDADEMLRIGYLTQITESEELDTAVDTLAAMLASRAPVATQGMKLSINEIIRNAEELADAGARFKASLGSRDLKEGVAAFFGRREPEFHGH